MCRRCWSKELARYIHAAAFRNSSRLCRDCAKPCTRLPCPRSVQQSARCSNGYPKSSTPFCEHETFRPGQSQRRSLADFVPGQVRSEEVCHGKIQCRGAPNGISIICTTPTLQQCHCGGDCRAKCLASSACYESLPCFAQQHNSTPNSVETTSVHAHIPVTAMCRRYWSKELARCIHAAAFCKGSR